MLRKLSPAPRPMTPPNHLLIIGGTGMLAAASKHLVELAHRATLVARGRDGLERIAQSGEARTLAVDYHHTDTLINELRAARREHGPFDLVLLWIHSTAEPTFDAVVDLLGEQVEACRVFDVRGSASTDPTSEVDRRREYANERVDYRRVVLGYVHEQGVSRWLTHDEICTGVLQAIANGAEEWVVGKVRPRGARP
ncbi:hypothetical protein FIV42_10430 [Persicimonas caeni]|uniref:Short-chain dehydrogenase n=2 Tax=Persicimonas caeni TaxID=2292766 RepID=A0A4Y6PS27_PERCE|nr:hypothetical protein FIV42_10430 [Persicimonas caeni]QED32357.1 hypothetical protein FRD00_10425 [Persicimonas caeni]